MLNAKYSSLLLLPAHRLLRPSSFFLFLSFFCSLLLFIFLFVIKCTSLVYLSSFDLSILLPNGGGSGTITTTIDKVVIIKIAAVIVKRIITIIIS